MKTLDATQAAIAERAESPVVRLVVLTTFTDRDLQTVDEVFYFSDRSVLYDWEGNGVQQFEPFLINLGDAAETMTHLPRPDSFEAESALRRVRSLVLRNGDDETPQKLWKTLRAKNLERAKVEVAELLLDLGVDPEWNDLRAWAGTEHTMLFRGEVDQIEGVDSREIRLRVASELPSIPWLIASDASQNDPLDLGKRLPVVYGQMKRVPAIGWTVGAVTTLAASVTAAATGTFQVTDSTGFGTTGNARIAGEEIAWTGKTATALTGVTRAQSSTTAVAHIAGESIVEVLSGGVAYIVAGHQVDAINDVYVRSPFNGELVRVTDAFTKNVADTGRITSETVASISMTAAQLRTILATLAASAEVTTQPAVTHATAEQHQQQPIADTPTGHSNARDGNVASVVVVARSTRPVFEFSSVSGTFVRQTVGVHVSVTGTTFKIWVGATVTGPWGTEIATLTFTGTPAWADIETTREGDFVRVDIDSGTNYNLFEVRRTINVTADAPTVSTPTAIEGAAVGFGLRFFADVDGYEAPDSNYEAASGTLLEKPTDIVRHLITELGGLDPSVVDATAEGIAHTNLGTSTKHAFIANALGLTWLEVVARFLFEARMNLVAEELAGATTYRMLAAESDYNWPAAARTLTLWSDVAEEGRAAPDPGRLDPSEIATRFTFLYAWDPSRGDGFEAFDSIVRIDQVQNDHTNPSTTELENAEKAFGRIDADPIAFLTIRDTATTKDRGGYQAHERIRVASVLQIQDSPPPEAYDLERGDVIDLVSPTSGDLVKARVTQRARSTATGLTDLRAVEVE